MEETLSGASEYRETRSYRDPFSDRVSKDTKITEPPPTESEEMRKLYQDINAELDTLTPEQLQEKAKTMLYNKILAEKIAEKTQQNKANAKQASKDTSRIAGKVSSSKKKFYCIPSLGFVNTPFVNQKTKKTSVEIGEIEWFNSLSHMIEQGIQAEVIEKFFKETAEQIRECGIKFDTPSPENVLKFLNAWPNTSAESQLLNRQSGMSKLVSDIRKSNPNAFIPENMNALRKFSDTKVLDQIAVPPDFTFKCNGVLMKDFFRHLNGLSWQVKPNPLGTSAGLEKVLECRMTILDDNGNFQTVNLIPSSLDEPSWIPEEYQDDIDVVYGLREFRKIPRVNYLSRLKEMTIPDEFGNYTYNSATKEIKASLIKSSIVRGEIVKKKKKKSADLSLRSMKFDHRRCSIEFNSLDQSLLEFMALKTKKLREWLPFYSVLLSREFRDRDDRMSVSSFKKWFAYKSESGWKLNINNPVNRFRRALVEAFDPTKLQQDAKRDDPESKLAKMNCDEIFAELFWNAMYKQGYGAFVTDDTSKPNWLNIIKDFYNGGSESVCWTPSDHWNLARWRAPATEIRKISDLTGNVTEKDIIMSWDHREAMFQINNFLEWRFPGNSKIAI